MTIRTNRVLHQVQFLTPDLAWERNKNFNVGFDTRLFERLSFSFDYYNRLTTDLLQDVPTSMTVGFTSALKT